MSVKRYRHVSGEDVDAIQWTGNNHSDVIQFIEQEAPEYADVDQLIGVVTSGGAAPAHLTDWIAKNDEDEFFVVPNNEFGSAYKQVSD
jgi:hypothetical protein